MSTDDLDDRIRALVRDAVGTAPSAPELPTEAPAATPDRRRWVLAGVGIAASLALLGAALAVSNGGGRTTPVGPTDVTSTTVEGALPWPDGVAVLVASGRGIERVTAENGQAVVTKVLEGVAVTRAFELPDGLIVYQRADGDIRSMGTDPSVETADRSLVPLDEANVLQDADLGPDGYLQLVYRTAPSDPTLTSFDVRVNLGPNANASTPAEGAWAVSYGRISIVDDTQVIAATIDDTLQRFAFGYGLADAPLLSSQVPKPVLVAGDGDHSVGWVDEKGFFTTMGSRSGLVTQLPDLTSVTDIDLRTNWLAVQRDGTPSQLVDLSTGTFYELPVANGAITLSRAESASTLPVPTSVPSPETTDGSAPPATGVPVQNSGVVRSCLQVNVPASVADVVGMTEYFLDGIQNVETIEISGRPATVTVQGEYSYAWIWAAYWCGTAFFYSLNGAGRDQFVEALSQVTITESLPEDMVPVLTYGPAGAAVISSTGTTTVTDVPVDDALLLRDGRVVFHSPDLGDFQLWDPRTTTSEPIWSAADFVEMPVLQDAYLDTFVFSVGRNLYRYDTGELVTRVPADVPQLVGKVSFAANGAGRMRHVLGALSPDEQPLTVVLVGGEAIQVTRPDGSVALDWALPERATVVSLDIRDGWVVAGLDIQPAEEGLDGTIEVRLIDIATGDSISLSGAQAHLG